MYCGIYLGSDETVVSIMTGSVKYHPVYLMVGNVHNSVKRAHRGAVVPIAFLSLPRGKSK